MKNPRKILVIRFSSIGDILLTTPLLRLLRKRFPNAFIGIVVKEQYKDLVRTNIYVDEIFTFDAAKGFGALKKLRKDVRQKGFDLFVDIHKNFRSYYLCFFSGVKVVTYSKFRIKRFFLVQFGWNLFKEIIPVYVRYINSVSMFGVKDDGNGLDFFQEQSTRDQIMARLKDQGYRQDLLTVCLAPGASFETKRWPKEYFANIAKRFIQEHNAQVILLGDEKDKSITQFIAKHINSSYFDLAGQLNLMQTACALSLGDVVVTNDTGLMHMAVALKKKTITVFGPTSKELGFFPVDDFVSVIENNDTSCRPCTHIGSHKCPKGHFKCMKDVTPEKVYTSAITLLNTSQLTP